MKKLALLLSTATLMSTAALAQETITRDFQLVHDVAYSCQISVTNNNIEDNSLVLGTAETADLNISCADLSGLMLTMQSVNGGMHRQNEPTTKLHYNAVLSVEHTFPEAINLSTQRDGTKELAAIFQLPEGTTTSANGSLSVTLDEQETPLPPGSYKDTLRVTLISNPGSAAS